MKRFKLMITVLIISCSSRN